MRSWTPGALGKAGSPIPVPGGLGTSWGVLGPQEAASRDLRYPPGPQGGPRGPPGRQTGAKRLPKGFQKSYRDR